MRTREHFICIWIMKLNHTARPLFVSRNALTVTINWHTISTTFKRWCQANIFLTSSHQGPKNNEKPPSLTLTDLSGGTIMFEYYWLRDAICDVFTTYPWHASLCLLHLHNPLIQKSIFSLTFMSYKESLKFGSLAENCNNWGYIIFNAQTWLFAASWFTRTIFNNKWHFSSSKIRQFSSS